MRLTGLKIIRPVNCLFAFVLTIFAYDIAKNSINISVQAIFAAISTFLIAGGGNILNDFFDYKIDLKNKPYRPIPSKNILRRESFLLSLALFVLGLIVSSFVNSNVFMIATVATMVLIVYGFIGKFLGFAGDILISFLTALVFVMGAFIISDKIPFNIILIALATFTINLSREVVKDIEDYEADKGYKITLPQKIGKERATLVALMILMVHFLVAYILLPIYFTGIVFLISVPLVILLVLQVMKNLKTLNEESAKKAQEILKLIMFVEFLFLFIDKLVINLII